MVEPELTIVFDIAFEKALIKLKNPLKEQAKKKIKKIMPLMISPDTTS